jgi:hypothetical protein
MFSLLLTYSLKPIVSVTSTGYSYELQPVKQAGSTVRKLPHSANFPNVIGFRSLILLCALCLPLGPDSQIIRNPLFH